MSYKSMFLALALSLNSSISFASEFAEPDCIKPNIDFWQQVYSELEPYEGYVHHMDTFVIYRRVVKLSMAKDVRRLQIRNALDLVRSQNPHVDPTKIRFQSGVKNQFDVGRKRFKQYGSLVKSSIAKRTLPPELVLVPGIESMYNPTAGSKVGAQGMFQIMPRTARMYAKRKVSRNELRNPAYAAQLGLTILTDNYAKLGSWPLAIMAYHSGLGGMRRAVESLGTTDTCSVILGNKNKSFKFASKNYYAQFLALKRLLLDIKE